MILTVIVAIIGAVMIYQLNTITKHLRYMISYLASLDGELFHLAQEQNPTYGICSHCGQRNTVRHVIPKEQKDNSDEPDMFFCHRCYWLSSTVMMGDNKKHYKDRQTREDIIAAKVGPGTP